MRKPQGKNAKRQAVRKQQLRGDADAKRAKGPPLAPSPPLSALPRGALDLHVVFDLCIAFDAADEVPSGEHPMGDHPLEAASFVSTRPVPPALPQKLPNPGFVTRLKKGILVSLAGNSQ